MLEDRDYMRKGSGALYWSATIALLVLNVVAYILQKTILSGPNSDFERYLELSLAGLKHGYVWQLVTFQLLHANFLHLLFNCLTIFFFGRAVETLLGRVRFLQLYFLSGIVGGLLQMLLALALPKSFDAPVVGASAGAAGLVGAFTFIHWYQRLTILLFFIPMTLTGKTLFWVSVILATIGVTFSRDGVAHGAHLGGILMGYIQIRWGAEWMQRVWERRPFAEHNRKRELIKAASIKIPRWPSVKAESPADVPSEEFISREVDPILEKISAHGIQSLTDRERRILEAARNRMAKR